MKKRTHSGPRRTKFTATSKATYKHPLIIALSDVSTRFDDACIRELALIAKLPPGSDLEVFGWCIREAAEWFLLERRIPTTNEVRNEIALLHDAAERRAYKDVARRLYVLSLEARAILGDGLPAAPDLRDDVLRDSAAAAVANLCRSGGRAAGGRRRSGGKRSSSSVRPYFYAPTASRSFPKREAEGNFVERISVACKAMGKKPPRTARRSGRDIGPFVRLVRKCLCLVGVNYADPVALINEVGARARTPIVMLSRINT